jgi:D-threonate/D-erythronate kinase
VALRGLTVGIIADDLTGACDTALPFFEQDLATRIVPDWETVDQTATPLPQVWSINTDSRHIPAKKAAERVARAALAFKETFGIDRFFKKIDSTGRGNIAWECLGMIEALEMDCAIIVPAYPAERRQTIGGYQLLRSRPIEQSEVARDPLCPVRQSHIPTLLQTQLAGTMAAEWVGHVQLIDVLRGAGPLLVAIREQIAQRKRLIVVDASSQTDMEQIGLAIAMLEKNTSVLACGSGGLGQVISQTWLGGDPVSNAMVTPDLVLPKTPLVVVSGSNTPLTRQQIQQLLAHPRWSERIELIALTPGQVLQLEPLDSAANALANALATGKLPLITSALNPESYNQTIALGKEHDLTRSEVAGRVQEALKALCEPLLSIRPLTVMVCGGETASQFCRFSHIQHIDVLGRVERNVPIMRAPNDLWLVTKSGNFGDQLTLIHVLQYLHEASSNSGSGND